MRQPSKYLFFGSQPDGPESTRVRAAWLCGVVCVTIPWQWPLTLLCVGGMRRARFRRVFVLVLVCACACACARACAWVQPATGKRSERVRRFKKSREPSLAQVDAERKAAIQRCKLEPLDTTHGVNSALRVVLSSPDLRSKRQVRATRLAWHGFVLPAMAQDASTRHCLRDGVHAGCTCQAAAPTHGTWVLAHAPWNPFFGAPENRAWPC